MVYRIELERNHFRMEKIRIITESASDMGTPEREDVTVLPMHITFGEKEYLDGVDLSHREFYNMLIESDELPKTSRRNLRKSCRFFLEICTAFSGPHRGPGWKEGAESAA